MDILAAVPPVAPPLSDADIGRRIRDARLKAGFATEAALGDALGLDQPAVSRIEAGKRKVSATELALVAHVLRRPAQHFLETDAVGAPLFRLQPDQELDREATKWVDWVEQFSYRLRSLREFTAPLDEQLPRPQKVELESPGSFEEAERAASVARAQLQIGSGSAPDMFELLERTGCAVVVQPMGISAPDAIYVPRPLGVVLLNGNRPRVRQRFTLAHELAHHLFHWAHVFVDSGLLATRQRPEQIANKFAAFFLMPTAAIELELVQRFGVRRPEKADHAYWLSFHLNVSFEALCWHLANVGMTSRQIAEAWQSEDRSQLAYALGLSGGERQKPPVEFRWPPEFLQRLSYALSRGLLDNRDLRAHVQNDDATIRVLLNAK